MVPRLTFAADGPSRVSRRWAISPAALFVKVKAQLRAGSKPNRSTRYRMRCVRPKVFPAPGPARTRSALGSASMASRCEGDGETDGGMGLVCEPTESTRVLCDEVRCCSVVEE